MTVVFKLGGSLLTLPDLPSRLRSVVGHRANKNCLVVVGGGTSADLVREWSHVFKLDEETAHWLAISSLDLNRQLLESLLSWKSIEDAGSIEHALDLFLDHLAKVERSSDQSDRAGEETSWPLAWTVALVSVEVSRRWLGIGDTASGLRPRGKRSRIDHSKAPLAKLAGWPGSWSSRFP